MVFVWTTTRNLRVFFKIMNAKETFHVGNYFEHPYNVSIDVEKEMDVIYLIRTLKKLKDDGLIDFPLGISFTLTAINDEQEAAGIEYPDL